MMIKFRLRHKIFKILKLNFERVKISQLHYYLFGGWRANKFKIRGQNDVSNLIDIILPSKCYPDILNRYHINK